MVMQAESKNGQKDYSRGGGESPLEEKAKIHNALESNNGDRVAAAKELGISRELLENKIYNSPDLRRRWSKDDEAPPDGIDVLTRGRDMTPDEERLAAAVIDQDKRLRDGFQSIGCKPQEVALGLELASFGRTQYVNSMDLLNSGMVRTFLQILMDRDKTRTRLEKVRKNIESIGDEMTDERVYWVEEEKSLALDLANITKLIMEAARDGRKGALDAAIVRYKLNQKKKEEKPAFRAMDVDV